MPTMSGPNPLSVGGFNADANQSGATQLQGGLSSLGQAIASGPQQRMQAQLYGAQAGQDIANTQRVQKAAQDQVAIQGELQAYGKTQDVSHIQNALAIGAGNPDIAAKLPATIAGLYQVGGHQAQADKFAGSTGAASFGSTPTGQTQGEGASYKQGTAVAGIGAGATIASANIGAAASRANNAADIASNERMHPLQTATGPDGAPVFTPPTQAAGKPAYDSSVATAIAGKNAEYGNFQGPNGTTVRATNATAAAQHLQPRPQSPTETAGIVSQDAVTPPPSGAPSGLTPGETGSVKAGVLATAGGQGPIQPLTAAESAANDKIFDTQIQRYNPSFSASNKPSPDLLNALRVRADQLRVSERLSPTAAAARAMQDIAGPNGQNLMSNTISNPLNPGVSEIVLKPTGAAAPPSGLANTIARPPAPVAPSAPPGGARSRPAPAPVAPTPTQGGLAGMIAPPPAAPAPAPAAQPQAQLPPGYTPQRMIAEAQAAVRAGKDPAAVAARLKTMGLSLSGQ